MHIIFSLRSEGWGTEEGVIPVKDDDCLEAFLGINWLEHVLVSQLADEAIADLTDTSWLNFSLHEQEVVFNVQICLELFSKELVLRIQRLSSGVIAH